VYIAQGHNAVGQNPILTDGKLTITPNEWLIPVAKSVKVLRADLEKVRTEPLQTQKASEEAVRSNLVGAVGVEPTTKTLCFCYCFHSFFRIYNLDYPFVRHTADVCHLVSTPFPPRRDLARDCLFICIDELRVPRI